MNVQFQKISLLSPQKGMEFLGVGGLITTTTTTLFVLIPKIKG